MKHRFWLLLTLAMMHSAFAQQGIRGQVIVDANSFPVENAIVWATEFPRDPDTSFIARGVFTDAAGRFVHDRLEPGTYFMHIELREVADFRLIPEVYDDIQCDGTCDSNDFEELYQDQATLITVAENTFTEDIDYRLSLGASISGTLTNQLTGEAIDASESISVRVQRVDPVTSRISTIAATFSEPDGSFTIAEGLFPGDYTLLFDDRQAANNFFTELFDDELCFRSCAIFPPSCDLFCEYANRTEINIQSPTAQVELAVDLTPAGAISGMVTDAISGAPLAGRSVNASVDLYQEDGTQIASIPIENDGSYSLRQVPAGNFFARAQSLYSVQLYDAQDCPGDCDITQGTPIPIALGAQTEQVNFMLLGDTLFIGGFESLQ